MEDLIELKIAINRLKIKLIVLSVCLLIILFVYAMESIRYIKTIEAKNKQILTLKNNCK